MQKAIKVKASIKGGKIEVPASIGATVVRVVGPPTYRGVTEVTPSDAEQTLPTKDKLVRDDIMVHPAPVEGLLATSNGQFTPSDGHVGFYQVNVNVNPDLRPLSVSENGQYSPDGFDGYSDVTVDVEPNLTSLAVTENGLYLPESGVDGFDRVSVDVPVPSGSTTITENGTYDVEQFASAVVAVPDQYLIAEWTEESENLAFCNYWTGKIPNRDESNYNYILLFYGNTHANGVQLLIYGLQSNGDVIAVRFNNFRIIDNLKSNDSNIYALYVSAGTRVRLFKIPKITS